MYYYIGSDYLINSDELVGLFDIETTTVSATTRDYLTAAQRAGKIINVSQEIPKTFVVCRKNGETTVYLSQYSANTISKRRLLEI